MTLTTEYAPFVVTVAAILAFKIAVILAACFLAKLGHDLIEKGVTGQFKFQGQLKGVRANLLSASPGLFFIFMAAVLLVFVVVKDKPFEASIVRMGGRDSYGSGGNDADSEQRPKLPAEMPTRPAEPRTERNSQ